MDLSKITIKNLPDSAIEIEGELSAEDFESFYKEALKEISTHVKLDGFRPGNIPENILVKEVGDQVVLEHMAEMAISTAYVEIIKEKNLKVIGKPHVHITKIARNNPLGFKIETATLPEITLPDYKSLAKKANEQKEATEVKDEEVQSTLNYLQKARTEKNDKGEDVVPELNDEFAKSVGEFETLDALKKTIYENLLQEKKIKGEQKKRMEIINNIAAETKVELPKTLIELEKDRMLEEIKANIADMGLPWEKYLENLKKTEEEILSGLEEDAKRRIKSEMALAKIAEEEKIDIDPAELAKEVDHLIEHYKSSGEHHIDRHRVEDYLYNIMRNNKVMKMLETL